MRLLATTTMATAAIAAAFAVSAPQAEAQVAVFATNPQGSLGYRTGIAVAKTVTEKVDGVTGRPRPMGGSTTYIPIVNRGEVGFGFTNALEAHQAVVGEGSFKGRAQTNLRLMGNMFPLVAGLAVPADAGVKNAADLKKLKGKRATSEYTSLTAIESWMRGAIANAGMDYDKDFKKVPVSGFVKGIFALGEGKTDVTWISLGNGAGRKVMTQLRNRGGWVHVNLDDSPEAVARMRKFAPPGSITKITNTKLPGITGPTNMIQFDYVLFTHKGMSDEVVYKITKALATNKKHLASSMGLFNRLPADGFAKPDYMPWHPGALKALKELGLKK
jgi:TRAP transporter TAXI family solute receptor